MGQNSISKVEILLLKFNFRKAVPKRFYLRLRSGSVFQIAGKKRVGKISSLLQIS